MFKLITKSLRIICIINTSWQQLQTDHWSVNSLSKMYEWWQIMRSCNALVLLASILAETSILLMYYLYGHFSENTYNNNDYGVH